MNILRLFTLALGVLVLLAYLWPSFFTIGENLFLGNPLASNISNSDSFSFAVLLVYVLKRFGLFILLCLSAFWLVRRRLNNLG